MRNSSFIFAVVIMTVTAGDALSADYVIGSFEGTTIGAGTGWKDWSSVNTFENSTIGATQGSMSVKVSPDQLGYQQGLAVKIQDISDATARSNAFDGFMNNTHVAVDVTWNPADWNFVGPDLNFARVIMYYNEMGTAFGPIGPPNPGGFTNPNIDTGNAGNPGFWDSVNYTTLHTRTMMWDYSPYKAAVTSTATDGWIEFMITTQAGNFSPPVAFYFDNIRFTTPVPGDYNVDNVVNAADYTVWRNRLGQNFTLPGEVANTTPGTVTIEDYNEWKARFGNMGSGSGSVGLNASGVPEPATWLLLSLAAATMCCASRRGR